MEEQKLRQIAGEIVKDWKKVGLWLGFGWKRLERLEFETGQNNIVDCIFGMLVQWNHNYKGKNREEDLANAQKSINCIGELPTSWEIGDIDDDIFLYAISEELGNTWKDLGITLLKYSKNQLEQLEKDSKTAVNAAMEILYKWRSNRKEEEKKVLFVDLSRAVEKAQCHNLAQKLRLNIAYSPLHINRDDVENLSDGVELGCGGFAEVVKARYLSQDVAVKLLYSGRRLPREVIKLLIREVGKMRHIRHKNAVSLLGVIIENSSKTYGIVMEYMKNGSLKDYLDNKEEPAYTFKNHIAFDICCAMTYLHKIDIIHRDLKSSNVLLDENLRAKVSDFGLSHSCGIWTTISMHGSSNDKKGTITHMAPEALKPLDKDYSPKKESDVWSMGILLFELCAVNVLELSLYKRLPFPDGISENQIQMMIGLERQCPITEEQCSVKIKSDCPQHFLEVMQDCTQPEMKNRPTFNDLLTKFQAIRDTDEEFVDYLLHKEFAEKVLVRGTGTAKCPVFHSVKPGSSQVSREFESEVAEKFLVHGTPQNKYAYIGDPVTDCVQPEMKSKSSFKEKLNKFQELCDREEKYGGFLQQEKVPANVLLRGALKNKYEYGDDPVSGSMRSSAPEVKTDGVIPECDVPRFEGDVEDEDYEDVPRFEGDVEDEDYEDVPRFEGDVEDEVYDDGPRFEGDVEDEDYDDVPRFEGDVEDEDYDDNAVRADNDVYEMNRNVCAISGEQAISNRSKSPVSMSCNKLSPNQTEIKVPLKQEPLAEYANYTLFPPPPPPPLRPSPTTLGGNNPQFSTWQTSSTGPTNANNYYNVFEGSFDKYEGQENVYQSLEDLFQENPEAPTYTPTRHIQISTEKVSEIEQSKLRDITHLQKGDFCDIFVADFIEGEYQVQVILKQSQTYCDLECESKALNSLRHPNIVSFIGMCSPHKYLVTECLNKNLLQLLKEDDGKTVKFPKLSKMLSGVLNALCFLEDTKYIHRSLRASNVLVGAKLQCKLSGFRNVAYVGNLPDEILLTQSETVNESEKPWLAPECLQEKPYRYSIKSDVWAFGVMLYETFSYGKDVPTRKRLQKFNDTIYKIHSKTLGKQEQKEVKKFTDSLSKVKDACCHEDVELRQIFKNVKTAFVKICSGFQSNDRRLTSGDLYENVPGSQQNRRFFNSWHS